MYELVSTVFSSIFGMLFWGVIVYVVVRSVSADPQKARAAIRRITRRPVEPVPDLDWQHFYGHVAQMFIASRHAVADGDLTPVRPFLDDRAESQLQRVMDECAAAGVRLRHDALKVDDMQAVLIEREPTVERIRVLIHASSVLKASPIRTAGPSSHIDLARFGNGYTRRAIEEYWTLVRQAGSHGSADDVPLSECPNCGAPLREEDRRVCGYCGATLVDPDHPWDGWTVQSITGA